MNAEMARAMALGEPVVLFAEATTGSGGTSADCAFAEAFLYSSSLTAWNFV